MRHDSPFHTPVRSVLRNVRFNEFGDDVGDYAEKYFIL